MTSIDIRLLQIPKITIDAQPLLLPYQKAEALFYYLAVEKRASREQLTALLWDNRNDADAKKNLRHAIYTIRSAIAPDCILSEGRRYLLLNPSYTVTTDYERLLRDEDPNAYQGEFLENFYVKNALPFEEWLREKRSRTLSCYQKLLRRQLFLLPVSEQEKGDELFERLMAADPLDESACRMMMERCRARGLYYKGIRLYHRLSRMMEKELSASPGQNTCELYEKLLEAGSRDKPLLDETAAELPGFRKELSVLSEAYRRFLGGSPAAVLIFGGEDDLKTRLAECFADALAKRSLLTLKVSCLETEKDTLLAPFQAMLAQLKRLSERRPDLNLNLPGSELNASVQTIANEAIMNQIPELLHRAGEQTPLVLFMDDLQYCDPASLKLLSLLIQKQDPNLFLLLAVPAAGLMSLSRLLKPLVSEKLLLPLALSSRQEEAPKLLPDQVCESSVRVNSLRRFLEQTKKLTGSERSILELLSVCQEGIGPETLADILELSPLQLLNALERLKKLELVAEQQQAERRTACFTFKSSRLRKDIYEQLSASRRCYYHTALAEHLRHMKRFFASDYECLIYHYCHAGNRSMEIKYRILALEDYASRSYELHPLRLPSRHPAGINIPSFTASCDLLEDRLLILPEHEAASIQAPLLYTLLLRTKALYCIAQGEYSTGLSGLKKALLINSQSGGDPLIRIRCLRIINFYRLNIWSTGDLEGSLSECLRLDREGGYEEDYAIDCRLYGLYQAMEGNYATSLRFLKQALRCFNQYPLKSRIYTQNIAGCYNYMGETYRKQKHFARAVQFYEKAIAVCEAAHDLGNAVFYSNLGRALLALGDREESARAFEQSNKRYNETPALIGRSITKGYVSILEAEKGNYAASRGLLKEALKSAALLASPYSLGLLHLAAWELLNRWKEEFSPLLPQAASYYRKTAESELKDIPGAYELDRQL